MPWDWKGGKSPSGVYDSVLPDADSILQQCFGGL